MQTWINFEIMLSEKKSGSQEKTLYYSVENSRTGITWKKKDQWLGWYGVWFGKMARGKFWGGWKFLYVVVVTLLFMFVKMYSTIHSKYVNQ